MKKTKKSKAIPNISQEELVRNQRLQRYYPLGMVNAIWEISEALWSYSDNKKERRALAAVFDAISKYDDIIRDHRHRDD